ncbi:MAG: ATP-binding protein [Dehalococcoidia bacterium]
MFAAARRFVNLEGPRCLVLVGGNGSGKSHILEGIGRAFLKQQKSVRYELSPAWIQRLRDTHEPSNPEVLGNLLYWYDNYQVFLLDDIGMERSTKFAREQLNYMFDARLASRRGLVVATNYSHQQMVDHVGPRLASRLYADNPDLDEVALVVSEASDCRRYQPNTEGG